MNESKNKKCDNFQTKFAFIRNKNITVDDYIKKYVNNNKKGKILCKNKHELICCAIESNKMELIMITNRGIKVWPEGFKETFCTDHWRCRFKPKAGTEVNKNKIIALLSNAISENIDIIKTENLYNFNGEAGYSLGQGQ
jgi:hypothetical protein